MSTTNSGRQKDTLDEKLRRIAPESLRNPLTYKNGTEAIKNIHSDTLKGAFSWLESDFMRQHPGIQKLAVSAVSGFVGIDYLLAKKDLNEREMFRQNSEYIRNARRGLLQKQNSMKQAMKQQAELDEWLVLADAKIAYMQDTMTAVKEYDKCRREGIQVPEQVMEYLDETVLADRDFSAAVELQKLAFDFQNFTIQHDLVSVEYVACDKKLQTMEVELTAIKNQILTAERALLQKKIATSGYASTQLFKTLNEQVGQARAEEMHAEKIGKSRQFVERFQQGLEEALPLLEQPFPSKDAEIPTSFAGRLSEYSIEVEKGIEDMRSQVRNIRFRRFGR